MTVIETVKRIVILRVEMDAMTQMRITMELEIVNHIVKVSAVLLADVHMKPVAVGCVKQQRLQPQVQPVGTIAT